MAGRASATGALPASPTAPRQNADAQAPSRPTPAPGPQQPGAAAVTVVTPGSLTTLQDVSGRRGYWHVGVPPSGAFDARSAGLAARAVGNPQGAAGLEFVLTGPVLRFSRRTLVCVSGAADRTTVDGRLLRRGVPTIVPAGGVLDCGPVPGPGLRGYLAVRGGFDVAAVLGSRSTFLLGGFGGLHGRALLTGDTLNIGSDENAAAPCDLSESSPELTADWELAVLAGPHGEPEHLAPGALADLLAAGWQVDHRADRTGIRLLGPSPRWSRSDGGEAGLHPSNLHDSAYPVGGIMLSGDTPVIVGPDGPSLGGFVVPLVVADGELWKLGQLRPGDAVRLRMIDAAGADALRVAEQSQRPAYSAAPTPAARSVSAVPAISPTRPAPLLDLPASGTRPALIVRSAGDRHLLAQAGPDALDLSVRLWVHLLAQRLRARLDGPRDGMIECVEGVRSLLVAVDPDRLSLTRLAGLLGELALDVPDSRSVTLDVREVTLPIAFDDPAAHEAMARYAAGVRPDAPWCPDNVEFIRRVNALDTREDVFTTVAAATYLVVGLGDVYLGAPVAVPIDPRHRLVTTKYDPPRTWTPENAVGIGGVYLCVYGMEGPGGYQLVGRTVPVWRPPAATPAGGTPWLLRQFDRLRFTPVSPAELLALRREVAQGRRDLATRPASFTLSELDHLEKRHAEEITAVRAARAAGFDAERRRWADAAGRRG